MTVAKSLLGQLGEGVNIEPPFFVGWGCNVFIGDNVYINRESVHVSFALLFEIIFGVRLTVNLQSLALRQCTH